LIGAQAQPDIGVGKKLGKFGASIGVVNVFDGLRHLMELLEGNETKFYEMKCSGLVAMVGRVDQVVVSHSTLDAWSTKSMALGAMVGQMQENLIQLCDKRLLLPWLGCITSILTVGFIFPGTRLRLPFKLFSMMC
jgi:hypothetical protein